MREERNKAELQLCRAEQRKERQHLARAANGQLGSSEPQKANGGGGGSCCRQRCSTRHEINNKE